MTNQQPIKPVFRADRPHGETIEGYLWIESHSGCYYIQLVDEPQTSHAVLPETIQISIDGVEFHSMQELKTALEIFKTGKPQYPCYMCSKNAECNNIGKMIVYECFQMREFDK